MIQFKDNPSLAEILEYLEAVKSSLIRNPNRNNELKVKCNPIKTNEPIGTNNPLCPNESRSVSNLKRDNEPKKINNPTGTSESLNKSNPLSMNKNKEEYDE